MECLVIAPHADDAEFGMGGYLSRMTRTGVMKPTVAVIAGGDYVNRAGELVRGETRLEETSRAMQRLGVDNYVTLGAVAENGFDVVGRKVLMGCIDQMMVRGSFEEVFICLPSWNQDHEALFAATMAAFRPGRHTACKRLWAYEYPGVTALPTQPAYGRCYVTFAGHDMKAKQHALAAHRTQFEGKLPNHCGPHGAHMLAQLRGSEAGAEYAELFWLIREVF